MRIAQVAPLAESVPPQKYGGTERIISWLVEELVALGHEVTLFAAGNSRTSARLVPVWPRATRLSRPRPDPLAVLSALLESVAKQATDFDVIHCHTDWVHLPLITRLGVPHVTTLHGRLDLKYLNQMVREFPNAPFVSISESQRQPLPDLNWLGTIHHGLPPDLLRPSYRSEGYLAFLGRIAPEKGPDVAIRLAQASGLPLRIAAKVPRGENQFFEEKIEPLVDHSTIRFIGEVDDQGKATLLQGAAALLFPIDWPEPFGIVMIEAMACGTPVIAWRRGSVAEIIEEGVTGFIVETEAEASAAIGRIETLDRKRIRQAFESRFTSARMAEDYVRAYERVSLSATKKSGQHPFR
ncbi:MAG: glycosyltransferase family 4 protein [Hyphomicrobiales bacterium]|nr:glycosyltransferase family 4 protein [Hyphomicrobiales bacterium]